MAFINNPVGDRLPIRRAQASPIQDILVYPPIPPHVYSSCDEDLNGHDLWLEAPIALVSPADADGVACCRGTLYIPRRGTACGRETMRIFLACVHVSSSGRQWKLQPSDSSLDLWWRKAWRLTDPGVAVFGQRVGKIEQLAHIDGVEL